MDKIVLETTNEEGKKSRITLPVDSTPIATGAKTRPSKIAAALEECGVRTFKSHSQGFIFVKPDNKKTIIANVTAAEGYVTSCLRRWSFRE